MLVAAQVYLWGAAISFAVALLIKVIFLVVRTASGGRRDAVPGGVPGTVPGRVAGGEG